MNKNKKSIEGFATLMLVIIISGIISAMIFPVLLQTELSRTNGLDGQFKEESMFSAKSCITALTLLFAEFGEFSHQTIKAAAIPNCSIYSVSTNGENRILKIGSAGGNFATGKNHTLLRVVINISTNKIVELEEVALF